MPKNHKLSQKEDVLKSKTEGSNTKSRDQGVTEFIKSNSFFLIAVILLISSLILLGQAVRVQHRTFAFTKMAASQKSLPAGTDVNMGNVSMRVDGITRSAGQPHFSAPAGKEYLVLTFTVQNRSDKPIQVLPTIDTYVKDSAGNVSYLTPYGLKQPFHAGELPAGETIKGQLSFLVAKSADLKFYVDGIWSGGVASFNLM